MSAPPPPYTLPGQPEPVPQTNTQFLPPKPQGYAVPQAPIYPPPQGIPQAGYYPPQPAFGYHSQPGYAPAPPVSTHTTNTVVVAPQPAQNTVIINKRREGADHALHAIISIFFLPWVFVWLFFCITQGL